MAKLPNIYDDPTLDAINQALIDRESRNQPRQYLGISSIGKPCSRELWYQFRWCMKVVFDSDTLKRFEDGHRDEDLMAERIRMVHGIDLWTLDSNNGGQIGVSDLGGHFKGHLDGVIKGILQAPKTTHVWEHKTTNEKKWEKLRSLIHELGEKAALEKWDEVYYAQAVLYMFYMEFTRHYLTVSTPGGRKQTSCRTNENKKFAKTLIKKAESIITSNEPLTKLSEKPEYYQCKWCSFSDICHGSRIPDVHCRTCVHATPAMVGDNGDWFCNLYSDYIPVEFQRKGCERHVYLPSLIPHKQIDANEQENWIEYEKLDGVRFRNGDGFYSSEEIQESNHEALGSHTTELIKKYSPDHDSSVVQSTKSESDTENVNPAECKIPEQYRAHNADTSNQTQ